MNKVLPALLFALAVCSVSIGQQPENMEPVYGVPDINGRATLLIRPDLPGDVLIKHDGATLVVKVMVETDGNPISADCGGCPPAVKASAESAAMASKFRPLVVNGTAVKFHGTLMYTIAIEKVNWFAFGGALYSTYIFDNLSLGPLSQMLTSEWADEKAKLDSITNRTELDVRWKAIESVHNSVTTKLNATDKWWYSFAIAMRKATAPFMSTKPFDRKEVQEALTGLKAFTAKPPDDASTELIEAIKTAAEFKIPEEMTNKEIYEAVRKLSGEIFARLRPVK
jgi:hypothetical protein